MFKDREAPGGSFVRSSYMTFTPSIKLYHSAKSRLRVFSFKWSFRTLRIEGMTAILSGVGVLSSNIPQVPRLKGRWIRGFAGQQVGIPRP